jgi:hypothetical protein
MATDASGTTRVTTPGPGALTSEVTIVPADDPAQASWFLGARLSAHPVGNVHELRGVVDQRLSGTQARVARAETELARQLASDLQGHDEAADAALIEQTAAIRLAVALPLDAELRVGRLRQQTHELRAATSRRAEADGAVAEAERRLQHLAPGAAPTAEVELLREAAHDIAMAEAAAQAAQADLGTAAKAVRPEERIELRAAGKRAYQADLRYQKALRETKPLVAVAIALVVVAVAAVAAAAAGAVTLAAAGALSGVLVVLAVVALLQRRAVVRPARRTCVESEATARALGDDLREREDVFGDWGVRVLKSMAADDALRGALQRWETVAGHDVDPERVEELVAAVAALDDARARRGRAADEEGQYHAGWLATATALGIATEPAPDPGRTLELAERSLAVRDVATDRLRELYEAERRLSARMRLSDLLRGRTLVQLEHDARLLTAEAGDDDGGDGALLYIDQEAIGPDERVELLQEARRLGPDGRFVVVTRDPSEWDVAHSTVRRSNGDEKDPEGGEPEIDLRDAARPMGFNRDSRPWFAS